MAYIFKGGISFGLVYIPIQLSNSIKNNDISFNLLDKKTMSRVKYIKTCVDCDEKEVKQKDIVKGYQYEKDKYVILEDEDFEKIKTKKDQNITIQCFVDAKDVDPILFDRPYYVVPNGAESAFKILLYVMEKEDKVAIAKCVLGTKETLIMLRSKKGRMYLNTLFFDEEVLENPAKEENLSKTDIKKYEKEIQMAKTILESMYSKFEPEKFKDEYRERLIQAIEKKVNGKQITKTREKRQIKVLNLMDALKKSLDEIKTNKPIKINSKSTKNSKQKNYK